MFMINSESVPRVNSPEGDKWPDSYLGMPLSIRLQQILMARQLPRDALVYSFTAGCKWPDSYLDMPLSIRLQQVVNGQTAI